ncbi:LysR family transcriptional regulator [Streptosporangium sp. CA-135522]|uniref:LysR family transcriptional regulator n=1 Tax=Streptosporangium sp. CA-135522 TaxID=3240072 RepID=UPI003D8F30AE
MDLDLAQTRAFVVTAEELHFGRAAERLFLTQQALSKRIARLEDTLGVRLFLRGRHSVDLTEAGHRFLEPARKALTAADLAVTAARHEERPLRIDVWGHLYSPLRTVRNVIDLLPKLGVELGFSRDLPAAINSLSRAEIDVGFGRVHPTGDPREDALTHRLSRLEPLDAVLSTDHPLAGAAELRPADLRDSVLWGPALDRLDFLKRFAEHFAIPTESGGVNLGLDHFLDHVRTDPRRFSLLPADSSLPDGAGVRAIPLTGPTPLYAWSLMWRTQDQHPLLGVLLREFAETASRRRWLDYSPERDWLSDADHAEFLSRRSR